MITFTYWERRDRSNGKVGGIISYISEDITYNYIIDHTYASNTENLKDTFVSSLSMTDNFIVCIYSSKTNKNKKYGLH
jgi:hypothetical protein